MAAFLIPAVAGFLCLGAEFGHGLSVKVENQRVADLAAVAAANAYMSSGSSTTMTSVAQNIAQLNGVAASAATATLVTSPRTPGSQAVQVSVSTQTPLYVASVVGFRSSLTVTSTATAEIGGAPSCVLALSASSSGVSLSGGTSVSAPSCSVASNASVTAPCGTTISARSVTYNGSAPTQGCGAITAPIRKAKTSDPLAGNSGVSAASSRVTSAGSLAAPTINSVTGGGDVIFGSKTSEVTAARTALQNAGCSATYASSTYSVTCAAGGTYRFSNVTINGGVTVNLNVGAAPAAFEISGYVDHQGTALNFGPGTYTIAGGLRSGGGSTTNFGAGTFNIGRFNTAKCNNVAYYSLCNLGSSMTFGGPSTFVLTAGVYNKGGSSMTLGSGAANSFNIGPASDGNAINIGGGAATTFADASLFQVYGNIVESGGACTSIGAATNHDIRGNVSLAGGLTLGSGLYAISGYLAIGAGGGGDVNCGGTSVGVRGAGVTLAVGASSTILGSGSCNGSAVCMGAGFSNVSLSAPSSGTYKDLLLIGPSGNSAGMVLNEGANTTFAGALYVPNGSLTLSGGASIGNAAGQCLQIIARDISLSGGTSITSNACVGSTSATTVKLVQ